MMNVHNIRNRLVNELEQENFITDKSGVKTIELIGQSFIADEDSIIGLPNSEYINREINWYESMSLYVNDIQGETPAIWKQISSNHGRINSNYGWCIWSEENGNQYDHCLKSLINSSDTRRAIMIYTRPSMQTDYKIDGMSDFMCTNAVQYLIRNNKMHAVVNMRSNDAWAGFRNDFAWQDFVLDELIQDYNAGLRVKERIDRGNIIWNVGSIHVYDRQFYLLDHWNKTGEWIKKSDYTGKWK